MHSVQVFSALAIGNQDGAYVCGHISITFCHYQRLLIYFEFFFSFTLDLTISQRLLIILLEINNNWRKEDLGVCAGSSSAQQTGVENACMNTGV